MERMTGLFTQTVGLLREIGQVVTRGYSDRDARQILGILAGNITPEDRQDYRTRRLSSLVLGTNPPLTPSTLGETTYLLPVNFSSTVEEAQRLELLSSIELDQELVAEARESAVRFRLISE